MMLRHLFLIYMSLLYASYVGAKSHSFIGVHKALKDTQNSKGKVEDKPFSPTIGFGYNFNLFNSGYGFSPQIGYIHTTQTADDSFGKQKIHTIYLHWDFISVSSLSSNLAYRFGIGNFIKRTSGKGGTVEIPNGSGTDQARRPSKTISSYSSTFDFGLDYNFDLQLFDWGISDIGLRAELFIFRPLSSENRNYAFNIGTIIYF